MKIAPEIMSDLSLKSPESIPTFLLASSLEEFEKNLPHFSYEELAESFAIARILPSPLATAKLHALIAFIDSPERLKRVGAQLTPTYLLDCLEVLNRHGLHPPHLGALLAGLRPTIFSQALILMQASHFAYLKQAGVLEPLQYHLTQFIHEGEALAEETDREAKRFIHALPLIQPEQLTYEEWEALTQTLHLLENRLAQFLKKSSAALALAWSTDRIDLIERLSSIHESIQHLALHTVGHPESNALPPGGLYLALEQRLSTVFDDTLKEGDAALEGLTRLGIWELRDYWEIGLLPSVHSVLELELDPQQHNAEACLAHQHRLLSTVRQQLEHLHLRTVEDLKRARIFSKPLLNAYMTTQNIALSPHRSTS